MELHEITTYTRRMVGGVRVIESETIYPLEQLTQQYRQARKKSDKTAISKQYTELAILLNLGKANIWNLYISKPKNKTYELPNEVVSLNATG